MSSILNNIRSLIQIMAWCRTGDKPLSEPMMFKITDVYMRHSASMNFNDALMMRPSHMNDLYQTTSGTNMLFVFTFHIVLNKNTTSHVQTDNYMLKFCFNKTLVLISQVVIKSVPFMHTSHPRGFSAHEAVKGISPYRWSVFWLEP